MQYDDYYPNSTMAADWDVVHEIVCTLKELTNPPQILHIKGHQDDAVPYESLSLPAQLNVDADAEAELYQTFDHRGNRTRVLRLPHTTAQLNVASGTITNKYKRDIVTIRTGPALRAKIVRDNRWSPETFDQVDWQAHG